MIQNFFVQKLMIHNFLVQKSNNLLLLITIIFLAFFGLFAFSFMCTVWFPLRVLYLEHSIMTFLTVSKLLAA